MLLFNPKTVRFGDSTWDGVRSVAIARRAERLVEEWSDDGPYCVLADVPEQRVSIAITQELAGEDLRAPKPGEAGALAFHASPAAGDAGRIRVRTHAVVTSIDYEVSHRHGARRTVTLLAITHDGALDPITIDDASRGSLAAGAD